MSDDLHAKIRAEVERRLAIARAATSGPWRGADWSADFGTEEQAVTAIESGQGPFPQIVRREDEPELVMHVEEGGDAFEANLAHVLLHDPADAISRYEHALCLLDRHQAVLLRGGAGAKYYQTTLVCRTCSPPQFAEDAWPCPDVLDLATSLGIVVSEPVP